MKVLSITGKRKCALIEKPEPVIKGEFVKVKIVVAPMCTEYKDYQEGKKSESLGHEAAGEVVEVARDGKVKEGDRVVVMPGYPCGTCELCKSGDYIYCEHYVDPLKVCGSQTGTATFAQYCIKQDWLLLRIPDNMSYEHASMACCGLGPAFGAAKRVKVNPGDTVVVTGLGPVGLGVVIIFAKLGASVIGIDSVSYRCKLALKLGARAIINPHDPDALKKIKDITGKNGADISIECSGVPSAREFCINATRRRGQIAFIGWGGHLKVDNIAQKGFTIYGIWHWPLNYAEEFMKLISELSSEIDMLITHRFPMSKAKEAFELQIKGECGKILLDPWR
ncbi:zinc-binding dehydrogenase [bacterium]|nr:zinc-binding dehydrogenase [bacterium]